ncbi:MAG: amidohydrolase family protein [Gammaproteobacteria bacterium]|nr:amidohydrolase family protein [Gammaproteobacteria bacterium]MYG96675.1 amidohydrolase family protein [Gammaproteobacteria bacterium]
MHRSHKFAAISLTCFTVSAVVTGCGAAQMGGDASGVAAAAAGQPLPCRILPGDSGQTIVIGQLVLGAETAEAGAIRIENGVIAALGGADEIRSNADGATVIDCADWYVSPGFINAHEHLAASGGFPDPLLEPVYAHREQWQGRAGPGHYVIEWGRRDDEAGRFWIELRHLFGGTTTLGGGDAVPGLLKNAYFLDEPENEYRADTQIFPFPNATAMFEEYSCPFGGAAPVDPEFLTGAPSDMPFLPHIAEGINCTATLEGQFYLDYVEANPGRRYSVVHGVGLQVSDIERLSALDVTLVWSPRSNVALYNTTVDIPRALNAGARIAIGTDWSYSGSYNMLEEFRCADRIDNDAWGNQLSGIDYWRMATVEAAYAMGLEDVTGRLTPGYAADLIVYRKRSANPYDDLIATQTSDVAAGFVDGALLTGYAPSFEAGRLPAQCANRIGEYFVCADYSDYPFDHAGLLAANTDAAPLFSNERQASCGVHR